MPRPLHPHERAPAHTEWAPGLVWTGGEEKQLFPLLGFELRIIQPVASDNVMSDTVQYCRDRSVIATAWGRRRWVQTNRLHRHGSDTEPQSALAESTAPRCLNQPLHAVSRTTISRRETCTANRHTRFGELTASRRRIPSSKPIHAEHTRQANSTPPDGSAERQSDTG
jgi:hypothetical protein